jgi:hypothetical protein
MSTRFNGAAGRVVTTGLGWTNSAVVSAPVTLPENAEWAQARVRTEGARVEDSFQRSVGNSYVCHIAFEKTPSPMSFIPLPPAFRHIETPEHGRSFHGEWIRRKQLGSSGLFWRTTIIALFSFLCTAVQAQGTLLVATDQACTYSVRMIFQGGTSCANQTPPTIQSACYVVNSSSPAVIPVPAAAPVLRAVEVWCNSTCSGAPAIVWTCSNGPSGTCPCGGVTLKGNQATGGFRLIP